MRARLLIALSLLSTAGCMNGPMFGPVDLVATIKGPATLRLGTSAQYTATVTWDGRAAAVPPTGPMPGGDGVSWSSSDTAVATVTPVGMVTAVGLGRVEIKGVPYAMSDGGTRTPGTLTVTVIE